MTWIYENKTFEPDEEFLKQFQGFVYEIEELSTGKKYIGKKFFWSQRKLPPLKGQKRKRIKKVQSDWQKYHGSSEELKLLVEENGVVNYKRTILTLCVTKGDCSYFEAKEQFLRDVLFREDYYNEFIGCKIHSKHLSKRSQD